MILTYILEQILVFAESTIKFSPKKRKGATALENRSIIYQKIKKFQTLIFTSRAKEIEETRRRVSRIFRAEEKTDLVLFSSQPRPERGGIALDTRIQTTGAIRFVN